MYKHVIQLSFMGAFLWHLDISKKLCFFNRIISLANLSSKAFFTFFFQPFPNSHSPGGGKTKKTKKPTKNNDDRTHQ